MFTQISQTVQLLHDSRMSTTLLLDGTERLCYTFIRGRRSAMLSSRVETGDVPAATSEASPVEKDNGQTLLSLPVSVLKGRLEERIAQHGRRHDLLETGFLFLEWLYGSEWRHLLWPVPCMI